MYQSPGHLYNSGTFSPFPSQLSAWKSMSNDVTSGKAHEECIHFQIKIQKYQPLWSKILQNYWLSHIVFSLLFDILVPILVVVFIRSPIFLFFFKISKLCFQGTTFPQSFRRKIFSARFVVPKVMSQSQRSLSQPYLVDTQPTWMGVALLGTLISRFQGNKAFD